MAFRGAKPKPAHLLLIDGTRNPTRHGSEDDVRKIAESSATSFGGLVKPRRLKGAGAAAWKRYIEPASWLDASREVAAVAFCELWYEFMDGPRNFPASKHGQMRAYMSELGLTDERNRVLDAADEDDADFA